MYFRFLSGIVLVVLVSLAGTAIEKQTLEYRRRVARQHFRLNVMVEEHARLRLRTQQMGAPIRTIESLENGELELSPPQYPVALDQQHIPLIEWQRAAHPLQR